MVEPDAGVGALDTFAAALRDRARAAREGLRLLSDGTAVGPGAARKLVEHHLPRWTERMTVSYLHAAFEQSQRAAEEHGAALYRELLGRYVEKLKREQRRGELAFAARLRGIERLGPHQVREHRRKQLAAERRAWESRVAAREQAWPVLRAILVLRVAAHGAA